MTLRLLSRVKLPPHRTAGGFDHGDVHRPTGHVFIAHTANGTIEVVDGEHLEHLATIEGCPGASGVLALPSPDLIAAAARDAGHVLFIAAGSRAPAGNVSVGPRPNGLAWDESRNRLLVADVEDNSARIVNLTRTVESTHLPGRPRWAVFDSRLDKFFVNIKEPSIVAVVDPETARITAEWPVGVAGPHGLAIDSDGGRLFVAADGGYVVCLDLDGGRERARVEIAGEPDATWFDPSTKRVYAAVGEPGSLHVIDADTMKVTETVEIGSGSKTTALDPDRQLVYVFQPAGAQVQVYATS
jgi:DNA-binding beta-propeller fold protein YncE